MPNRKKREKDALSSAEQQKINLFTEINQKRLSYTALMTLKLCSQGLNQIQIAKTLGCSPPNINKVIRRLEAIGLLTQHKVRQKGKINIGTARGGYALPYDVRWRSLKWILTKSLKLPSDERWQTSKVNFQVWHVKDATIRLNLGKSDQSLEISAGFVEGRTPEECVRKHDERCLTVYDWLAEHFPDVKDASSRLDYECVKQGELNLSYLKEQAEKWLEDHPNLKTDVLKIDDSLKNGGEVQLLLGGILSKHEFESWKKTAMAESEMIRTELAGQREVMNEMLASLKEISASSKSVAVKPKPYEGGDFR